MFFRPPPPFATQNRFSDKKIGYTFYLDESGHDNFAREDKDAPWFALGGIICSKDQRIELDRKVHEFKMAEFGDPGVILRASDMVQHRHVFSMLNDETTCIRYYQRLNKLVKELPFLGIVCAIKKQDFLSRYFEKHGTMSITALENPYLWSLEPLMERFYFDLCRDSNIEGHCIGRIHFEKRGTRENEKVINSVASIRAKGTKRQPGPYIGRFITEKAEGFNKAANVAGLQIADIIVYSVCRRLNMARENMLTKSVLEEKLRKSSSGKIDGWGIITIE